jgi:hypothetical protein
VPTEPQFSEQTHDIRRERLHTLGWPAAVRDCHSTAERALILAAALPVPRQLFSFLWGDEWKRGKCPHQLAASERFDKAVSARATRGRSMLFSLLNTQTQFRQ